MNKYKFWLVLVENYRRIKDDVKLHPTIGVERNSHHELILSLAKYNVLDVALDLYPFVLDRYNLDRKIEETRPDYDLNDQVNAYIKATAK